MDNRQLAALLKEIELGDLASIPQQITGGLIHRMWRAITDRGEFAVKQLNPTIMARPHARGDILGGEEIARSFAKKSVTVSAALCFDDKTILKVGDAEIMLFEWVDGITLEDNDVTNQHCRRIGELFGQMHKCKLSIENMPQPASRAFNKNHWNDLIDRAKTSNLPWAEMLGEVLDDLVGFSTAYASALPSLQTEMVASHRDLDIKNVIWDSDGSPVIIDWEAAGPVNPVWELLDAALNWCGQTTGHPDRDRFQALIEGYRSILPLNSAMIEPALDGCLGARMEWLEFNMQRSVSTETPSGDQALGASQVTSTLADILSLEARKHEFMDWLQASA